MPINGDGFWARLPTVEPFDPQRTLCIDYNLNVLRSARAHGFLWLLAISAPDSAHAPRQIDDFPAIDGFVPLLPARHGVPRSHPSDVR